MNYKSLRNKIAFVFILAAFCLPMWAGAQTSTVVTIGDTNNMVLMSGNATLPYVYGCASYTQQLVQGDELNGEAMITGISNNLTLLK